MVNLWVSLKIGFKWQLNQGKKHILNMIYPGVNYQEGLTYSYLEIKVEKNNLIGSIPSWGPSFKISFELKVLSFANCNPMGMANYLTFTATDSDCCNIGDRIPAFFTGVVILQIENKSAPSCGLKIINLPQNLALNFQKLLYF